MDDPAPQNGCKPLWGLFVGTTVGCWILIVLNILLWRCFASASFSVECLDKIWEFSDILTSPPTGQCLVNFGASFLVAYISFPLYHFFDLKEGSDLFWLLSKYKRDKEGLGWELQLFYLRYATCTGFLATAVIHAHSQALNLDWAVFLGFVGPYIMRDKVLGQFKGRVGGQTTRFLGNSRDEVRNIVKQKEVSPLVETMEELEKDLAQGGGN